MKRRNQSIIPVSELRAALLRNAAQVAEDLFSGCEVCNRRATAAMHLTQVTLEQLLDAVEAPHGH